MKVKKQRRHRKTLRFYQSCYGFREPYKVLCDGSFTHHLISNGLPSSPADALSRQLSARFLPFTSKCINAELKREGFWETLKEAQKLPTARCEHEKVVSATNCIQSVVGDGNPEHFFVATQDADIRETLGQIPGIPLIYALRTSLHIVQPSEHQRHFARSMEEKRMHISESEYQKLHKIKDKLIDHITELPDEDSDWDEAETDTSMKSPAILKNNLGVSDRTKFKRKRAKGPNPLSCLKRKGKKQPPAPQSQDSKEGTGKKKRIRIRKRFDKEQVHAD